MSLPKQAIDIVGYCAAAMTTVALLPQLTRILKTHSAGDISLGMFSIYTLGVLAWLVYGLLAHAMPVLIANSVSLVLATLILSLKIYFDHQKGGGSAAAGDAAQ